MSGRRTIVLWGSLAIVIAVLAAWVAPALRFPRRLPAVPAESAERAAVPGLPGIRYRVARDIAPFVRDVNAAREREVEAFAGEGGAGELPSVDLLAVSGGGDNGAFAAGLLSGWTELGTRPRFKLVTGVSTGALIAPFAFLGPEYDHVLRTVYTDTPAADISLKRSVLAALADDGMADNRPLWKLISRYVDEALLARIAAEYDAGRLLLVGTTDLDAREPVVWNMGAIASHGSPEALDLFRSILLASAAIPGAFPPTMIRVEVDGSLHEEMHVDGGTSAQAFIYPPSTIAVAKSMGVTMKREGRVWVIRNSRFGDHSATVDRRTMTIAARAIASLIHSQGLGDLYRIYLQTRHDGLDFNLAYIDPDFTAEHVEDFDPVYMNALFDYGYQRGRAGDAWRHAPPGLWAALDD